MWWLLLAVLILMGLLLLGANILFDFTFLRPTEKRRNREKRPETPYKQAVKQGLALMETLPNEEVWIQSKDGLKLHGTYFPAPDGSNKIVLGIHGYKASAWREYAPYIALYRSLGYGMFLPDNRAHGASEGRYIGFAVLDRLDCVCWAQYLANRFGEDSEILLHGVSMGAATVLAASGEKLPRQVKGIVADCGYSSLKEELTHEMHKLFHIPTFPLLPLCEKICMHRAGYNFVQNSPIEQVKRAEVPILFVHGDCDTVVPCWMAQKLYEACPTEKQILIAEGAAHAHSIATISQEYKAAIQKLLEQINTIAAGDNK